MTKLIYLKCKNNEINDLFKWQVPFYLNVDRRRRSVHSKIHIKADLLVYQHDVKLEFNFKWNFQVLKKMNIQLILSHHSVKDYPNVQYSLWICESDQVFCF
jgi:hypothetical protein